MLQLESAVPIEIEEFALKVEQGSGECGGKITYIYLYLLAVTAWLVPPTSIDEGRGSARNSHRVQ